MIKKRIARIFPISFEALDRCRAMRSKDWLCRAKKAFHPGKPPPAGRRFARLGRGDAAPDGICLGYLSSLSASPRTGKSDAAGEGSPPTPPQNPAAGLQRQP